MASRLVALLIAALLVASSAHAAGSGRVALVIGNAAYAQQPLTNPVNDARLMAETLRAVGYEVLVRENATKRTMETAILAFGEKLKSAGSGVFYYAGHGLQVRGRNYLVPVDAVMAAEAAIRVEGVDVELVLEQMGDARVGSNVVILDACRNNPFERKMRGASRGLAAVDAAVGTLIAYATAPGSVASDGAGRNGLYTEELAKAMMEPGLKAEEVFKRVRIGVMQRSNNAQTPWESSSLTGDLVFNQATGSPAGTAPGPAASAPRPPASDPAELAFWDAIKGSSNPAEFRAYLEAYPKGRFVPLARVRAQQGAVAAAPVPAQQRPVAVRPPAPAAPPPAPEPVSLPPPRPAQLEVCRARLADYSPIPQRLICTCDDDDEGGTVWGTDTYTDDSSICAAARHAGMISSSGGPVVILSAPGEDSYDGAHRNGVTSQDYGEWAGSFTFGSR